MSDDFYPNQNSNPDESNQAANQEPEQEAARQPEHPQQANVPPPPPPPPPGYYYQGHPQYAPYPPPQQPRRWGWLIPIAAAIGCLPWAILFLIVVGIIAGGLGEETTSGKHVALIHITGEIASGGSSTGPFSGAAAGSEDIIRQLEKIRKNDSAKAVVLRINSPGGSAAASEEVYNEIQRLRDDGKIVYTSMGDVAASGGYYIASASDKIYADSNTLTGSIGVIFPLADLSSLYKKIGYRPEVIKAGKFKDIGSSDRPLTAEERIILQNLVNDTYTNFLSAVAKGRKMPLARVKQLAEGRIYTGTQAAKLKLVDNIGGLHETVRAAAKAAGIKGEPDVVEYGDKGLLGAMLGSESNAASDRLTDAMRKELIKKLLQDQGEFQSLR